MFTSLGALQGHRQLYTDSCLHWRESTNRTTFASLSNLLSQEPKHYLTWPSLAVLSVAEYRQEQDVVRHFFHLSIEIEIRTQIRMPARVKPRPYDPPKNGEYWASSGSGR